MRIKRILPPLLSAVTVTTMAWVGPAGATDHLPGRFTGGGRFSSDTGVTMTHGFELHCFVNELPNNLEVNWTGGHSFHLEQMTWASCSDRPNVDPAPPAAPSDVHNGHGLGRLDGVPGAYADWRIIDKGEPGTKDRIAITIWDHQGGNVVIQTVGGDGSSLDLGNEQAHFDNQ